MKAFAALALAVLLWLAPAVAGACAVCGFGEDRSREAYLTTTLFMTLLPLAAVGGFAWWLWRRSKRQPGGGA
jgi:hypothetical protein